MNTRSRRALILWPLISIALLFCAGCAGFMPNTAGTDPAANDASNLGNAAQGDGSEPNALFEDVGGIESATVRISGGSDTSGRDAGGNTNRRRAPEDARPSPGTYVTRFDPPAETLVPARDAQAALQKVAPPAASGDKSLTLLLDESLAELESFADRPDAELPEAERYKKHRVQMRLIALHFLLAPDHERRYLEPLLKSLEESRGPMGKSRVLLAAALYHDLDLEKERDSALQLLPAPQTPAAGLRVANFLLCSSIEGYRRYSILTKRVLHGGEKIFLYGELQNLKNGKEGVEYVAGIDTTISLVDETGEARYRHALSGAGGDRKSFATPTSEQHFQYEMTVPRDLEGKFRLIIEVRDLYAKAATEAEIPIRIRK